MRLVKNNSIFFFFVCLFIFILFSLPLIFQPLHGDETWFAFFVTKDFGERFSGFFSGESQPAANFAVHPHLHYQIMRFFVGIGGSEVFMRLSGIFVGLLSIGIFYKVGQRIFSREKYLYLGLILLVTNPFFVQSSLLVDLDNTVTSFSMLFFSYIWLSCKDAESLNLKKYGAWKLIFATVLLFWSKFVAALVSLPALFLYSLSRNYRKLPKTILFLFVALSIFYLSWIAYMYFYKGDYFALIEYAFISPSSKVGFASIVGLLFDLLKKIITLAVWANPILLFIFIYLLLKNKFLFNHKIFLVVLMIVITLSVNFLVGILPGGFPRYWASVLPLIILTTVFMLDKENIPNFKRSDFLVGVVIGILYLFLGNVFIALWNIKYWTIGIGKLSLFDVAPLLLFLFLTIFILFGIKHKRILNYAIILIVFISIAINFQNLLQKEASNYNYGETGMVEVIDLIKNSGVEPKEVLIREDLAYYSFDSRELGSYKHIIAWLQSYIEEDKDIEKLFRKEKIKLVVWRDMDYFSFSHIISNPEFKKALKNYQYKRIGNFQIWQL